MCLESHGTHGTTLYSTRHAVNAIHVSKPLKQDSLNKNLNSVVTNPHVFLNPYDFHGEHKMRGLPECPGCTFVFRE